MRKFDRGFLFLIAFLTAFASMAYELLIARFLTSLSADSVLSQSLTIGTYLLALGLGASLASRTNFKHPLKALMSVEFLLAIASAVLMHCILFLHLYIEGFNPVHGWTKAKILIFSAQFVTLIIGCLAGFEIPLLIEAVQTHTKRAFGWILGMSYFGGLCASLTITLKVLPLLGVLQTAVTVSMVSAFIGVLLVLRYFLMKPSWALLLVIPALYLPPLLSRYESSVQQFYLKGYYFLAPAKWTWADIKSLLELQRGQPEITRITTPYQEIDIVPDEYMGGRDKNFHLYLDHRLQFGSRDERVYHDLMIHGSLNLMGREPAHVLILGGGDGLLVRELLRYKSLKSVTLVELDPKMIELSRFHPLISQLNQNSLSDSRVHIVIGDAFEWIRQNRDSYDAVFVDLPHPHSFELARLYSAEFYRFIYRRLTNDGFMTFDFPFYPLKPEIGPMLAAVKEAGFKSRKIFGFYESFAINTKSERELKFNYDRLETFISPKSAAEFAFVDETPMKEFETTVPNSVFKPRWLHYDFNNN